MSFYGLHCSILLFQNSLFLIKYYSLKFTENKKANDDDDLNEDREDVEDEEVEDEELDEGTDYANQYFDNGESYLDEDDNLDDEAVY